MSPELTPQRSTEPTFISQPIDQIPVPSESNNSPQQGNNSIWKVLTLIFIFILSFGISLSIFEFVTSSQSDLPTFMRPLMNVVHIALPNLRNTTNQEISDKTVREVIPSKPEPTVTPQQLFPTITLAQSNVINVTPVDGKIIIVEPKITAQVQSVLKTPDMTKITVLFTNTSADQAKFWPVRFIINSPTHGGGVKTGPLDMTLQAGEKKSLTFEYENIPGGSPYVFSYTNSEGKRVVIGTLTF